MEPIKLKPGDVVQIDPATVNEGNFFAGCFLLVTEPKSFGAQGFISMPGKRGEMPGRAFYRAKWSDMEFVGRATWIQPPYEEEEGEGAEQ